MESTEEKPPSKKALFEAVNLIESLALFQNDGLADAHCAAQQYNSFIITWEAKYN